MSSLNNKNQNDSIKKRVTEGGIFTGHGPLDSEISRFLVQAAVIITLSWILHMILRKIRQPRVIGEMLGGILLGPALLGRIPGFTDTLFPPHSLNVLNLVANVGLVFYLFLIGLELETNLFFKTIRRSVFISAAGIILPFIGGSICSFGLYKYVLHSEHKVGFPSFLIFISVAMSITAFPVLARILTETKLLSTPVGTIAISAAAIDDVVAWTLLALVVSLLHASDNLTALYIFASAAIYAVVLLFGVRLVLRWIFNRYFFNNFSSTGPVSQLWIAFIFVLLFLSAWFTDMIGVHAIFGAFIFGLTIPHHNYLSKKLTETIEDMILIGFLPLFFASSGLKTNLSLLSDWITVLWLFVVILVACCGKLLGCAVVARLTGVNLREALSIGVLMNTKGLVELIALNVGYDAGVIDQRVFLIMVIMALITTFITSPILSFIYPSKYHAVAGLCPQNVIERMSVSRRQKVSGILGPPIAIVPPHHQQSIENFSQITPREAIVQNIENRLKLLIYLDDDLGAVLQASRLISLLADSSDCESSSKFKLSAFKVIEATERFSSMITASRMTETVQLDSSLNMMRLLAQAFKVPLRCLAAVTPDKDVGVEVNYVAMAENCDAVLLTMSQKSFPIVATSVQTLKFREIIKECRDLAVMILAPRGEWAIQDHVDIRNDSWKILAVVSDCAEDSLILKLVDSLAKPNHNRQKCSVKILELKPSAISCTKNNLELVSGNEICIPRSTAFNRDEFIRPSGNQPINDDDDDTHKLFDIKRVESDETPFSIILNEYLSMQPSYNLLILSRKLRTSGSSCTNQNHFDGCVHNRHYAESAAYTKASSVGNGSFDIEMSKIEPLSVQQQQQQSQSQPQRLDRHAFKFSASEGKDANDSQTAGPPLASFRQVSQISSTLSTKMHQETAVDIFGPVGARLFDACQDLTLLIVDKNV